MTYTITTTDWPTHHDSLRTIRDVVFIQEQQVPIADEWDDKDQTAMHFLVLSAERKPVGGARVVIENNLFHIGRVAVLAEYRKLSIGRKLMQHVLLWCRQQNPEYGVYLHAQTTRVDFYTHLGFVAQGDIFMDAGIEHLEMWYRY